MVDQSLCRSHRERRNLPELVEPTWSNKRSEESEHVEVEVVKKSPPPHFNPPLIDPRDPVLIQVRELFSEPFSLFNDPHIMSDPSVLSSVVEPSNPSKRILGGTL
jgi:hypothetical protein